MDIQCQLELTNEELGQLAGILNCTIENLPDNLVLYTNAALEEYVRMFLGQKVFTRGSDFREYRLFLLVKHAFDNEIPDEQDICDRFQTTVTQSRSLLRSVMSKYQYELDTAIQKSLKKALESAVPAEGSNDHFITVDNENIINALNRLLLSIDGTLPPISKRRSTVSTYILKPSSRERLSEYYGIELEGEER